MNTREYRTRKRLEEQRHELITRMQSINPEFKPPSDYKYVSNQNQIEKSIQLSLIFFSTERQSFV